MSGPMRVLVLGANGQVGFELMRARWPEGLAATGIVRAEVDLTKPETIAAVVARHAPDLVINATAYTAVDKAESEQTTAFAVNETGVAALAEATAARGTPLLHISTDYVFDGTGSKPWVETDPIAPLGAYGASKAAGEVALRSRNSRHVILRTSWVYGVHGLNFVKTMQRLGRERAEMRVVADQHGTPTAALEIAEALIAIAEKIRGGAEPWGTYHFTARGETTWHGFAERVFEDLERRTGRRPVCTAITTADYPTPARRPANSRLDCGKFDATFALPRVAWTERLAAVLDELAKKA